MLVGGPKEVLATLNVSKGITSTILYPTSGVHKGRRIGAATFQPKTTDVYVTWDGGDADNTCLLLAVNDVLRLEGYNNLINFLVIEAAASATLLVIPEYIA